jgi:hypothetical protein
MVFKKSEIPDRLKEEVLRQHTEGKGATKIAEWLSIHESKHVSTNAVTSFLAKIRQERQELAKQVYRERLTPGIFSDLDMLDFITKREWSAYTNEPDDRARQNTARLLLKIVELRGNFMGLGKDTATSEIQAELLHKIQALKMEQELPSLPEPPPPQDPPEDL